MKPATYDELWTLYDEAIRAMRSLVSVASDAATDLEDLAKRAGVGIGSYADEIDIDRILAAISAADAVIEKRNEMARL